MPDQVKVEDFEAFRLLRGALLRFAQAAGQSLIAADSQIVRTRSWLENEQPAFWQNQLRKRVEAVAKARNAVRQKTLYKDATGRAASAIEEEKVLARCLAAVEQAEQKIEAVRKWLPRLEKEAEMYRSGVSRLGGALTVEVPRAVGLLDRLAATLEQYVQLEAPAGSVPESTPDALSGESMARGGDMPPQTNDTAPPATVAGPAIVPPAKEPPTAAPSGDPPCH